MNNKEKIIPYLQIRDKLETFTIVNCVSRKFPYNLIGHTAVLYRCPKTGQLMVLESTTLNKFSGKSGVQLTPFGIWLHNYSGKVYVRTPEFYYPQHSSYDGSINYAQSFIQTHLPSSYPDLKTRTGRFKLYMAALDFKLFGKDIFTYTGDDDGIFCTMLVVMFYQYCHLMRKYTFDLQSGRINFKFTAEECVPEDCREGGFLEKALINLTWSTEMRLK
jgi:hypothetical protein